MFRAEKDLLEVIHNGGDAPHSGKSNLVCSAWDLHPEIWRPLQRKVARAESTPRVRSVLEIVIKGAEDFLVALAIGLVSMAGPDDVVVAKTSELELVAFNS